MLAYELNHLLANATKDHNGLDNSTQKNRLSACFQDGRFNMVRAGQAEISLSEEEDHFAAKALLALTILRATYQKTEILTEIEAQKALGSSPLPVGFYALTPGVSRAQGVKLGRKIAAAYLPEAVGADSSPCEAFVKLMPRLVEHQWAAPQAFITRFEVDPVVFAQARDPFVDYMSIGGGMEESLKITARQASLSTSLGIQGLRITTVSSGGSAKFGFPAPLLLTGSANKEVYKSADHAKFHVMQDVLMTSALKDMSSMPIYNHDPASVINNTRDIDSVLVRSKERALIVATLVDAWMAKSNIISQFTPEDISMGRMSKEKFETLKIDAAQNEVKALGKPRKLFVKQGQTAVFCDDAAVHLILSMDMALVDGQHSSRDYGLIAEVCLTAARKDKVADNHAVLYMGVEVPDCKSSVMSAWVWSRYVENWNATKLNPEGFDDAVLVEELDRRSVIKARAKLKEDGEDQGLVRAVPKTSQASLDCERAVWEQFIQFAPQVSVEVSIAATVDTLMSRVYTVVENMSREQRVDSKAMAKHHGLVQRMVAGFNEGAEAFNDPMRLGAVKSQHANPDMSTADHPEELTSDFMDLFPYIKAVLNAERTAGARSFKSNKRGDEAVNASNWAKWEALGILESKGVHIDSVHDPLFLNLSTRLTSLYLASEALKGREFELSEERLLKTGLQLTQHKFAPLLKAFGVVCMGYAMKLLKGAGFTPSGLSKRSGNEEVFNFLADPDMDSHRIYAVCKVAMRLKDALRPQKRNENSMSNGLMNDTTLDNVMLTLLTTTARVEELILELPNPAHPASEKAVTYFKNAKARLDSYKTSKNDTSYMTVKSFNATREAFIGRLDKDSPSKCGDFQKGGLIGKESRKKAVENSIMLALEDEHPNYAALLIDAIPGPGPSYANLSPSVPALSASVSKKREDSRKSGVKTTALTSGSPRSSVSCVAPS